MNSHAARRITSHLSLFGSLLSLLLVGGCYDPEISSPAEAPRQRLITPDARDSAGPSQDEATSSRHTIISAVDQGELNASIGHPVVVQGQVVSTRASRAGHVFLNTENRDFYVFIPRTTLEEFGDANPIALYENQKIEVSGNVEQFSDKLQIRVSAADQIRLAGTKNSPSGGDDSAIASSMPAFDLRSIGRDAWLSPAGLEYRGRDTEGLNRIEHVQRHFQDMPDREGPHGVFDGDGDAALALIDEAWTRVKRDDIKPRRQGKREAFEVEMGRRVGYLGGQVGKSKGNPPLRRILIVVSAGTSRIITAYPK